MDVPWIIGALLAVVFFIVFEARAFRHPERQNTLSRAIWTLGEKWTDTKVLVDCGARLAEPSKSQTDPTKEYSMEQIGVLDRTDVLLVPSTIDGTAEAPENAPLSGNSLWKQLPAVKAGRVFPVLNGAATDSRTLSI